MKIFVPAHRNTEGDLVGGFIDETDHAHTFPTPNSDAAQKNPELQKPYYYLSSKQMTERMVFFRDGCRDQGFVPQSEKIASGELDANKAGVPGCGKFLIASPNEKLALPAWLWDETRRQYDSVEEFVKEADERLKKRKLLVQNQTK